jgi:hypothetical protein
MHSPLATTISESISSQLGTDTGFITSAVVSFSTIDGDGEERILVMYDGSILQASALAEYAAHRLEGIVYAAEDIETD